MDNRRYRDGKLQARVNAPRPFRHVRRIEKLANSTTTHSSLLPDHYFIWDPTEPVATRPLAWQRGTSVAYYTHDGNKNVSEVIASDNDVAAHYEYAPFGALTISRGESAAANPFRFSSEYAEDDTATVYYNYRHYEPVTGRWMQRDPIREVGGINLYTYAFNDGIRLCDIIGLDSCSPGTFNNVRIKIAESSQAYQANLDLIKKHAEELLEALGQMGKGFDYVSYATSGGVTALMFAIIENGSGNNLVPGTDAFAQGLSTIFKLLLKTPLRLDGTLCYEKCVCSGWFSRSWEFEEQKPINLSYDVPVEGMDTVEHYAQEYNATYKRLVKDLIKEMYNYL